MKVLEPHKIIVRGIFRKRYYYVEEYAIREIPQNKLETPKDDNTDNQ